MIRKWCEKIEKDHVIGERHFPEICNGILRSLYIRKMVYGQAKIEKSGFWLCETCGSLWKKDGDGKMIFIHDPKSES